MELAQFAVATLLLMIIGVFVCVIVGVSPSPLSIFCLVVVSMIVAALFMEMTEEA